jgi:hypothetical protein
MYLLYGRNLWITLSISGLQTFQWLCIIIDSKLIERANTMNIQVQTPEASVYYLEDDTFVCEHVNTEVETFEVDTMSNGEYDSYESRALVCQDCDEQLDWDFDCEEADMDDDSGDY